MSKPVLFVFCLVLLVAATSSALAYAESDPGATPIGVVGILERPGHIPEEYGHYAITDEATGVRYDVIEIDEYVTDRLVGNRFIIYGAVLEGYDPPVLAEWWTNEASTGEQPDPALVQYGLCTEPLFDPEMYMDGVQRVTHPCTPPLLNSSVLWDSRR